MSDISEFDEKELAELLNEAVSIGKHLKQAEESEDEEKTAEARIDWYVFAKDHRRKWYYRKLWSAYFKAST